MLLSVFFALMVGSPTHPPLLALDLLPHPPHRPVPCPHPLPPLRVAECIQRLCRSTVSSAASALQTLSTGSSLPGCTCPAPG